MRKFPKFQNSAFIALAGIVFAGSGVSGEKTAIAWHLAASEFTAARGECITLQLTGAIPDGYHTYSTKTYADGAPQATEISVAPDAPVSIHGAISYAKPLIQKEKDKEIEYFEKTVTFMVPVRIKPETTPGQRKTSLAVVSQLCTAKSCLPPADDTIEFSITVTDAPVVTAAPIVQPTPKAAPDAQPKPDGLLTYLGAAAVAGLLGLLTPCVFPMIPITVSFFTKRKLVSRARSIGDAAVYSLGIILTFTALALVFTLLLGATGIQVFAAHPWVNLAIAALFVAFAFSLFGFYEIQVPSSVLDKLNAKSRKGEGIAPILFMALVFSLTSFTCTVPFVGTVMVAAAKGELWRPLVGTVAFATVFAAPFFVLALFPAWLKSLPKSGGWLNSVKVVMGFLEIAAAMKFISSADLAKGWNLLSRPTFLLIWIALAVVTAAYLLGLFRFPHEEPVERRSAARWLSSAAFVGIAIFLSTGLSGGQLGTLDAFIPPRHDDLVWIEDYRAGLAEAKKQGKPVFIDFTGIT